MPSTIHEANDSRKSGVRKPWQEPAVLIERHLSASAQGPGPRSGPSLGPSFGPLSASTGV
jgi:hypothetical protein